MGKRPFVLLHASGYEGRGRGIAAVRRYLLASSNRSCTCLLVCTLPRSVQGVEGVVNTSDFPAHQTDGQASFLVENGETCNSMLPAEGQQIGQCLTRPANDGRQKPEAVEREAQDLIKDLAGVRVWPGSRCIEVSDYPFPLWRLPLGAWDPPALV